jgi:fibrillarin-like rRNA methylase
MFHSLCEKYNRIQDFEAVNQDEERFFTDNSKQQQRFYEEDTIRCNSPSEALCRP